jgi:hypothetical protein
MVRNVDAGKIEGVHGAGVRAHRIDGAFAILPELASVVYVQNKGGAAFAVLYLAAVLPEKRFRGYAKVCGNVKNVTDVDVDGLVDGAAGAAPAAFQVPAADHRKTFDA